MTEPIKQPEALRLADALVRPDDSLRLADGNYLMPQAAAELRRLHAEVEGLRAELARLTTLRPHNEHKQGDRVLIWEKVLLHEDRWLFWNHGNRCPPGAYWTPIPPVKELK
jgi:hypothetical protein